MGKVIVGVILSICALMLFLFFKLGADKPVLFTVEDRPEILALYKQHVGPYHELVKTIQVVEAWAKENNIDCTLSFGEYLNNPKEVEEERLLSHGGCLLQTALNPEMTLPEGFAQKTFPARKYVVAQFDGSPAIGPVKVYPRSHMIAEENKLKIAGPTIEVYQILNEKEMKTTYLFPAEATGQ